jgi:hypothetical protein
LRINSLISPQAFCNSGIDENQEMSETQPTTPAAGNLSAAMQEGTAQLPEPNHTVLLQVDVSLINLPEISPTKYNAELDTAE